MQWWENGNPARRADGSVARHGVDGAHGPDGADGADVVARHGVDGAHGVDGPDGAHGPARRREAEEAARPEEEEEEEEEEEAAGDAERELAEREFWPRVEREVERRMAVGREEEWARWRGGEDGVEWEVERWT